MQQVLNSVISISDPKPCFSHRYTLYIILITVTSFFCTLYLIELLFFVFDTEEGEQGLKRFLAYMTGRVEIPPLGMAENIEVVFVPQTQFFAETCIFN